MHLDVITFAANNHTELELKISAWLRNKHPKRIVTHDFAADGAEYTYCYVIIFEPRELPLPKHKKKAR